MINFKSDRHVHTKYSPDADKTATFKTYIDTAKQRGLNSITFTDHHDIDPGHPLFETPIDWESYIQDFNKVKKTTDFDIKLGVEVGYQTHVKNDVNAFIKKYPFEYVVLSIHYVENKDLYTKEYFQGKTKKEAYLGYFELLLDAVKNVNDFSVVGHLDYIPRYADYGDYDYSEYADIIDDILKVIISKNKGIEINTSGYLTENRMYPKKEIIDRFIELGGTQIEIGSDAHRLSELGRYYQQVKKDL